MKYIKLSLILFFLNISLTSHSQDIHWSMYDLAPLAINPAYTGDYQGSFRAGANYRGQWNGISGARGFTTSSVFVDAPVLMVGGSSWLGVGAILYNDNSGINHMKNLGVLGSVALHFGLSQKSILTLGFQGGYINRNFSKDNLLFEDQIVVGGTNLPFGQNSNNGLLDGDNNTNSMDLNIGLKYFGQISKKTNLSVGLSARHIASPSQAFIEVNQVANIPLWLSLHGRMSMGLTKQVSFIPSFIYQQMASAQQLNIQALLGFKLSKQRGRSRGKQKSTYNDPSLRTGIGYRAIGNDALMAIIQLNMSQYTIGLSYDLTISELSSTNGNAGAIELAFSYKGKASEKSRVRSKVYCPSF